MRGAAINLDELVDGQKVGRPQLMFLVITTLCMVSDGFDIAAIGYVGPELVKDWGVTPADLVPLFSSGIIGLFFGAPILGFIGDRFGRKRAIIIGLCLFGGMSLLNAAATSLDHFVILRFLTGVGLGGLIPNVTALAAENAPRRLRGRYIVIVNFGVAAGIMLSGVAAAALVPLFGWQVLLVMGGLLPLGVALLVFLLLPESIKYLAERGGRDRELRRLAQTMRPDLAIEEAVPFEWAGQHSTATAGAVGALFRGQLAIVTPLIWIALAANQMSNSFSLTWLPTLLQSLGSTTAEAGLSAALFSGGGLVGGVILILVIDRLGIVPLVAMFFIGVPLIAAIGMSGLSPTERAFIIAGAGFCVTGIQFGTSAFLGTVYPTPIRSTGTAWAQAFGRIGALAAPVVGGALLGMGFTLQQLVLAPALGLALGAFACVGLAVICYRRFGGSALGEFTIEHRSTAAPVKVVSS